jgi:2-amino-4-hydroxy-6-hydroxymethyldihydropteridine diphosphokinase
VIALGSNLGDRRYQLLRAIHALRSVMHVVRVSGIHETEPVDAPAGSPAFLNAVVAGYTDAAPEALLDALLAIEARLGRRRRGIRNEPRVIDLDLILYSGKRLRTSRLTVPHPGAHQRVFVRVPMAEVGWVPWD